MAAFTRGSFCKFLAYNGAMDTSAIRTACHRRGFDILRSCSYAAWPRLSCAMVNPLATAGWIAFFFPDRDRFLDSIHDPASCFDRRLSMRRRYSNYDARITDFQPPNAMSEPAPGQPKFFAGLVGDSLQFRNCQRFVTLILQVIRMQCLLASAGNQRRSAGGRIRSTCDRANSANKNRICT